MNEWLPGYPYVRSYAELMDYEIWFVAGGLTWHRRRPFIA